MSPVQNTPPGPGVDASGQAVIDPTKNVETAVEREVTRIDDMADLRAMFTERIADLRSGHTEQLAVLRADHAEKMQVKEAERLDAIRAVDAAAVADASSAAEARASALAAQVQAAAEAMRTQVGAAATAATENQAVALAPIQAAIDSLRQAQYEAQGQKTQVVETQAGGRNVAVWITLAVAGAGLFFTAMLFLIATAGLVITLLLSSP